MQDPQMPLKEASNQKPRKKKSLNQMAPAIQMKAGIGGGKEASHPPGKMQKKSKRSLKNDMSPPFQQTDTSTPDSLLEVSGSKDEYRTLRRKYLLLEEESFSLGRELSEVEAEVKTLEDEKSALLDQLVVLEGLMDASEIQAPGGL